jgi:hypothetical protein
MGVLLAWLLALAGLIALSPDDALPYAVGGVPLTIAVGALVDRWWVAAVPLVVSIVTIVGLWFLTGCASDGDCGGDDGFSTVTFTAVVTFLVPGTGLLLAGVSARRVLRRSRGPARA